MYIAKVTLPFFFLYTRILLLWQSTRWLRTRLKHFDPEVQRCSIVQIDSTIISTSPYAFTILHGLVSVFWQRVLWNCETLVPRRTHWRDFVPMTKCIFSLPPVRICRWKYLTVDPLPVAYPIGLSSRHEISPVRLSIYRKSSIETRSFPISLTFD